MTLIPLLILISYLIYTIWNQNRKIVEMQESLTTKEVQDFINAYYPKVRTALSALSGIAIGFGILGFGEDFGALVLDQTDIIIDAISTILGAIGVIVSLMGLTPTTNE